MQFRSILDYRGKGRKGKEEIRTIYQFIKFFGLKSVILLYIFSKNMYPSSYGVMSPLLGTGLCLSWGSLDGIELRSLQSMKKLLKHDMYRTKPFFKFLAKPSSLFQRVIKIMSATFLWQDILSLKS